VRTKNAVLIGTATVLLAACSSERPSTAGGQLSGLGNDSWIRRAPLPEPTRSLTSVAFDGKVFVFGGASPIDFDRITYTYSPGAHTRVYAYDPATDTWTAWAPMPVGLYYLTAHAIGDRIYVIGGYGMRLPGFDPVVLAYDPATDTWSHRSSRPAYSYVFMSAAVGERIFVAGGQGTIDNGPWQSGKPWIYQNRLDIYDSAKDTWLEGAPAPELIAEGTACAAGNRVYFFGESLQSGAGSFAYAYDVDTDSWSKVTPPPLPRNGHACVEVNGEFYLVGGRSKTLRTERIDQVEVYSPVSDTWKQIDPMPSTRFWIAASALPSGLLIMGGVDGQTGQIAATVEMLDLSHPR
jgi:N-acetylneuraminic acid mutarotase